MTETRKQAGHGRRSRDVMGSTAQPARATVEPGALTVQATQKQFYGGNRIRLGQLFTLAKASDFQPACMVRRDAPPAPATTTSPLLTDLAAASSAHAPAPAAEDGPTGDADPLGGE